MIVYPSLIERVVHFNRRSISGHFSTSGYGSRVRADDDSSSMRDILFDRRTFYFMFYSKGLFIAF